METAAKPPPVCPTSPASLSVKLVRAANIWRYVPVNALIVTDDETIFLAVTGALRDLRKVLLSGRLGYVILGRISKETLFVLDRGRGKQVTPEALAVLQPRFVIWLGFCRSTAKYHCDGDVIIADNVLYKAEGKQHVVNKLESSDFLARVFHDGRFGWSTPSARRQFVHREDIAQPATETELLQLRDNYRTVAIATPKSTDLLRTFSQGQQEWIAMYGIVGDLNYKTSWTPYVALVMSSLLCRVLRDDGIFSTLDRTCSVACRTPVQETATAHRGDFPVLPSLVENYQESRGGALASYSVVSQAPGSSAMESKRAVQKTPVENTCHSNRCAALRATVCKEEIPGDDSYLPQPPADIRSMQLYRRLRSFRLAQLPFVRATESNGTAVYGNTKRQHHAKYKGAHQLLTSRVLPPRTIHSGLASAVKTVLPPVMTSIH